MKKRVIVVAVVLLVVAMGMWFVVSHRPKSTAVLQTQESVFGDPITGLSFKYTQPLEEAPLSVQDKQDKFIARLTSTEPAMIVSVRYEEGLRAPANLAKQDVLELILSNLAKAYPQRYPGYKHISEHRLEVASRQAAELTFTYSGPSGQTAKQRLLIVLKDDNTAIYLSAQTKDSDFDELNTSYLDKIFNSIDF